MRPKRKRATRSRADAGARCIARCSRAACAASKRRHSSSPIPQHVAVALEYRPPTVAGTASARARARRRGRARVRAIARGYGIPIVENVALARALYRDGRERRTDSARALRGRCGSRGGADAPEEIAR